MIKTYFRIALVAPKIGPSCFPFLIQKFVIARDEGAKQSVLF